jgi:PAS domain S-box-containing protein
LRWFLERRRCAIPRSRENDGPGEPPRPDLEQLAERALDIIYRYRFRPTRGFEYVSPAVTRVNGYTPEEHYADPDIGLKLVHPDDRALLDEINWRAPAGDPLVIRWRRKDGKTIWTEQRDVPVYDDAGELVALEGIAREIPDPTRPPAETVRVVGGVRIDLQAHRVYADGKAKRLTTNEFKLLALLAANPGRVLTRAAITRQLWNSDHVGSGHACENHISTLRKKIERDPRFPERIVTVRGKGYTFNPR